MPLSKAKNRERMRLVRVQPNITVVQPKLHPRYSEFSNIAEQVKALYPDGRLPNCPDGNVHCFICLLLICL